MGVRTRIVLYAQRAVVPSLRVSAHKVSRGGYRRIKGGMEGRGGEMDTAAHSDKLAEISSRIVA